MSDKAWKQFERRAAAFFGARRAVLSGSSGRDDRGGSDSVHPSIYLEAKHRVSHTARTLHDAVKARALAEGKLPVLALACKKRPGFLVCIHSDDFPAVVAEWLAGLPEEAKDAIEGSTRAAYARRHGFTEET